VLSDPSLDTANLVALLKSPDPKILSLAIFALGRKNDPHLLAEIAPGI
jgi:HEAT repeat protein